MSTYYEILGLEPECTIEQVKQNYKTLAKKHHPDKGGDKETFQKIQEAYDVLSNEDKRKQYDLGMNNPFETGGHDFFSNLFTQMFKGKKRANVTYNCNVTMKDIFFGCKKKFNLTRKINCAACLYDCVICGGKGVTTVQSQIGPFIHMAQQPCRMCKGSGRTNLEDCKKCIKGYVNENKTVEIDIARGTEDKQKFSVSEWGEQPFTKDETPGDFIIIINVIPDIFKRIGLDLYYEYTIDLFDSILGKTFKIPHYSGDINVDTRDYGILNPKKKYIIDEKGMIDKLGAKGHLYITFNIEYPNTILSNDQVRELKKILKR